MTASKESVSRHIEADPQHVWDLITTAAELPTWYDQWDTIETLSPAPGLSEGEYFRLTRHHNGKGELALCHVTTVIPPTLLVWFEYELEQPPLTVEFRLETSLSGGTILTHTKTWNETHQA